ncbi:MAG: mannitol dehydrogenase family protein [Brevundimonas sp.]|nr:MAG: mannitol dehydrogenase family protein [Brevundimonas sp.]
MTRLSEATLDALAPSVRRPAYDRRALERGVVHLGLGAFHRAHQAVAYDDLAARGDLRWGVTGVSLRSPDVAERLNPQDGLYGVAVRDDDRVEDRIIGVLGQTLVAPRGVEAVVGVLSAPATRLVTLTITEKGYLLDPAGGGLMLDHPDIAADLAAPRAPRTAIGLIVAALSARRAAGLPAFTAMSCDNLTDNGERLARAVVGYARRLDPALAEWIERRVAFPATMVDRIVPSTEPEDIAAAQARTGLSDQGLVKTEAFTQWVVEDRFSGEAPDLAAVGVQLTSDVRPWETAKLRLLNGAHSTMAYLGAQAGLTYVHEVIATPGGRAVVEGLWDEVVPTVPPQAGLDLPAYRRQLLARFGNPALQHRLVQIAMDGSQKLPQRLFAPMLSRLKDGRAVDHLALATAVWIRWLGGRDDAGRPTPLDDPQADRLRRAVVGLAPRDQVHAVAALEDIVPPALGQRPDFIDAVAGALEVVEARSAHGLLSKNEV